MPVSGLKRKESASEAPSAEAIRPSSSQGIGGISNRAAAQRAASILNQPRSSAEGSSELLPVRRTASADAVDLPEHIDWSILADLPETAILDDTTSEAPTAEDVIASGNIGQGDSQFTWSVQKAGPKKFNFMLTPQEAGAAAAVENITGIQTYAVAADQIDLYYNKSVFLRLVFGPEGYEKELHYPLPNRLFGAGRAAGLRSRGDYPDLGLTMGFFEAVLRGVDSYEPGKRQVRMADGSETSILGLLSTQEAWQSGAPMRVVKDIETLLFAGASFSSKPAKILGTAITAAQIGGVWSGFPPIFGSRIVRAMQGSQAVAGSEYGSKSPSGAEKKAAIVGMVAKAVAAVFTVIRMQAMSSGNTRLMLAIQTISTLVVGLLTFSMSFALGLSSAIEAFGIGLSMAFIPLLVNIALNVGVLPAINRRFRQGRPLSPYIVNILQTLCNIIAFRITKALVIAGNARGWEWEEMEDTLEAQMVQQSMVVLFTTFTGNVALEASAYNADTRPFRNYYAENAPEAVSRYDRIYNRGFNLRSARPEDEAERVISNEDEEANPLELRRERPSS